MKIYYGTKKQWIVISILTFIAVIYVSWFDLQPKPQVKFGYAESKNKVTNDFFNFVNKVGISDEKILAEACMSLSGEVKDYAYYKEKNKGALDKRILEVIEPNQGFIEGWVSWEKRLYPRAPLFFLTIKEECVLYPTKGRWLLANPRSNKIKYKNSEIVLSCCWKINN